MNKFAKSNSKLFITFTLVCIFALFADGANITDLFPGTTTVHFDSGDGSQIVDQVIAASVSQDQIAEFSSTTHNGVSSLPKDITTKRAILDEDSPSLAAISVSSSESFIISPQEEKWTYHTIYLSETLYLQHCTLLI